MPRNQQVEVEPLSPAAAPYWNNIDDDGLPVEFKRHRRHQKYVLCCGCVTALILILVVVVCVLIFTVFGARCPKLRVNSLQIDGLDRVNWTDIRPNTNLSIIADVSVKNPNIASFKYNNASTILYYDGNIVGGAKTPGATAKAGRTLRLNVTMDILLAKVLNVSRLQADYLAGILPMSSYTRISGRVKIFNLIKRGVFVRTNCSMIVNVTSYTIKHQDCKRKVTL
ncbi:unnamed protein product [Coffea canephora]|uniref:Late embryogenesis abundant protein LEA-2 subgroup domain-containing protein n=1 Tax=Coffea canephora TaxID=49390 RepID=A0A068UUZ3_COFCA|nr:unnamed protein product [Coffea canephora]